MISLHEIKRTIKSVVSESRRDFKRGRITMQEIYEMIMEALPLDIPNAGPMSAQNIEKYIKDRKVYPYSGNKKVDPNLDKYNRPFIHKGAVDVLDKEGNPIMVKNSKGKLVRYAGIADASSGERYDIDGFRKLLTERPKRILAENGKMKKSSGETELYYNIGIPALHGLVVDESTGDFIEVTTCPNAGACKVYCYALRGNYIRFEAPYWNAARKLNFLVNDPTGFKNQVATEVRYLQKRHQKDNSKLVVRWHDAGDFFSPSYFKIAKELADEFPTVDWYGYTKAAHPFKDDSNVTMNFSYDAKPDQKYQIDAYKTKLAITLPDFSDAELAQYMVKKPKFDDKGKPVLVKKGPKKGTQELEWDWTPQGLKDFKKFISDWYRNMPFIRGGGDYGEQLLTVEPENILSYQELMETPYKPENKLKYCVVIRPSGDGDVAANRKDVWISFLMYH